MSIPKGREFDMTAQTNSSMQFLCGGSTQNACVRIFVIVFQTLVVYHLNRSVYRLGRFGQMASKFPYWENSVRDWRLLFAEIPTIYQKICTTATANALVIGFPDG